jgi:hypothetical protein
MNGKKAKALRKISIMTTESGKVGIDARQAYKGLKQLYKSGKIK